jgi:hypothetical protein
VIGKTNAIGMGAMEQSYKFLFNRSFESNRNKEIIASEFVITFAGLSSAIQ